MTNYVDVKTVKAEDIGQGFYQSDFYKNTLSKIIEDFKKSVSEGDKANLLKMHSYAVSSAETIPGAYTDKKNDVEYTPKEIAEGVSFTSLLKDNKLNAYIANTKQDQSVFNSKHCTIYLTEQGVILLKKSYAWFNEKNPLRYFDIHIFPHAAGTSFADVKKQFMESTGYGIATDYVAYNDQHSLLLKNDETDQHKNQYFLEYKEKGSFLKLSLENSTSSNNKNHRYSDAPIDLVHQKKVDEISVTAFDTKDRKESVLCFVENDQLLVFDERSNAIYSQNRGEERLVIDGYAYKSLVLENSNHSDFVFRMIKPKDNFSIHFRGDKSAEMFLLPQKSQYKVFDLSDEEGENQILYKNNRSGFFEMTSYNNSEDLFTATGRSILQDQNVYVTQDQKGSEVIENSPYERTIVISNSHNIEYLADSLKESVKSMILLNPKVKTFTYINPTIPKIANNINFNNQLIYITAQQAKDGIELPLNGLMISSKNAMVKLFAEVEGYVSNKVRFTNSKENKLNLTIERTDGDGTNLFKPASQLVFQHDDARGGQTYPVTLSFTVEDRWGVTYPTDKMEFTFCIRKAK